MYLLVDCNSFEGIRDIVDYEELTQNSSSESESECESEYVAVYIPSQTLNDIPYGIIDSKQWDALTFHVTITSAYTIQLPFSTIVDELTDTVVEVIKIKDDCWATFDSHWDCYCKTSDVCGCGCDPLHDGW